MNNTEAKELSRNSDPQTSKDAAVELVSSGERVRKMAMALALLRRFPGSTSTELDRAGDCVDGGMRKRLNDLRKRGLAYVEGKRQCRISGKPCQLWFPTTPSNQ